MSKVYFQYQGTIKSQAVAEAIAFPVGIGPFMGFARYDKNSGTMKATVDGGNSTTNQGKYYDPGISSQNYSHCVGYNPNDANRYKQGLITKSGHIYVSELEELPVTILNTSQGRSELIVMALYKNVEEPIINTPTLVGYWNNGNSSFYEEFFLNTIYSENYNLGQSFNDPFINKTFKDLYERVKAVVNSAETESNLVLIGIYGEGINPTTNSTEPFSIVPYGSKYPYSQPFTPAMYYTLKGAIDGISNFLGTDAANYNSLKDYITSMIPKPEAADNTLLGVPIGTIIMWNGSSIPDGWALCDGSNGTPDLRGRFPLGETTDYPLNQTGGSATATLTIDNLPSHYHEIKRSSRKIGDNNHYVPIYDMGKEEGDVSGWGGRAKTEPVGENAPFSVMNPWCAVKFIMRIK